MKKILSVVLAGAMILGMSVASFAADKTFGGGDNSGADANVAEYYVKSVFLNNDKTDRATETLKVEGGDVLYFSINKTADNAALNDEKGADKDWSIKISNADCVKDAVFFVGNDKMGTGNKNDVYVKVTLEDEFESFDEDVEFYFYLTDSANKTQTDRYKVQYKYKGLAENELKKRDLDWVLNVEKPTTYKYLKGEKAGTATLDLNGDALAEMKMYPGEKYKVDPTFNYNKDLSREYGVDVSLLTVRDDMEALFFKADKDNKVIVALDKHGDLVEVDAKYVTDYKFGSGKRVDGYLVEDVKYGKYAKVSNKIELNDKKDEDKVDEDASKPTADTTKPNPAMGANDFVGAAVALAVVSVAAAGALSLKK